jgi:hypothetical protein
MDDNNDRPAAAGADEYDDAVLDAGWLPQPDSVSPEPQGHPPRPSRAARDDADAFIKAIYRSQGCVD